MVSFQSFKELIMAETSIKQNAQELIESLPDSAGWEELMYRIYVREAIESGLADSEAGRVVEVSELRRRFGLPS